jgi:hypothetical protein
LEFLFQGALVHGIDEKVRSVADLDVEFLVSMTVGSRLHGRHDCGRGESCKD